VVQVGRGHHTRAGLMSALHLLHDLRFTETGLKITENGTSEGEAGGREAEEAKQMCPTPSASQAVTPAFGTKHMLYFLLESRLPLQTEMVLYVPHHKITQTQRSALTSCLPLCSTTAHKL